MPDAARMGVAITKLAVGTAFYVVLISIARYFPTAAGMMLTFPALNGLTLAVAPAKENVEGATRTMLLMPVLNCLLCGLYIFAFLWLHPGGVLLQLMAALGIIWLIIAATVVIQEIEIRDSRSQSIYVAVSTICLLILLIALLGSQPPRGSAVSDTLPWWKFAEQNVGKVGLFAFCLAIVILVSDFLSLRFSSDQISRLLGAFGGFPIVPFFGLYAVADPAGKHSIERLESFGSLAVSVWVGPVIAFGFILLFSHHLQRRGAYDRSRWLHRFAWALPFWAGCFAVIIPATALLEYMRR